MYDDARLAAVYDVDNPDGPDHDFFRALADEMSATMIVDLGCGTGILTVTLTRDDREVTGIDPAPAMLDYARNRPGADRAHWIQGTSDKIAPDSADLYPSRRTTDVANLDQFAAEAATNRSRRAPAE